MSRWRRWWSLWSRSGMKMVKLRASSSQLGQVEIICSHLTNLMLSSFGITSVITLVFRCVGYSGGSLGWEQHPLCFIAQQVEKQNIQNKTLKLTFEFFSGATTQGNFKRNLQKFKNREDVKVCYKTQKPGSSFKLSFVRFFLCQSVEVQMASTS